MNNTNIQSVLIELLKIDEICAKRIFYLLVLLLYTIGVIQIFEIYLYPFLLKSLHFNRNHKRYFKH